MAEKMSKKAEQAIVAAVGRVADLVNSGATPDEAIEKVARDEVMPRGHVQLLVNAYNVGRTTRQCEDGTTPAEKAADFPVATYAHILDRLYPEQVKSAADRLRDTGVSSEYLREPDWYTNRVVRDDAAWVLEKAAEARTEKQAILLPLGGAGLGALMAPAGHKGTGAWRGAGAGLGVQLGSTVGMAGDLLTGSPGLMTGLGGYLGYRAANAAMGPPSWEKKHKGEGDGTSHEHKPHKGDGDGDGIAHEHQKDEHNVKAAEAFAGSPEWRLRKAASDADRLVRSVAESRLSVTSSTARLIEKFAALREYFRGGKLAVADVRPNVEAAHGSAGAAVLDQVIRLDPGLTKKAASSRYRYHSTLEHPEPYGLVRELVEGAQALNDAQAAHEKLASDAEAQAAEVTRPFVQPHPGRSVLDVPCSTGASPAASSTEKAADMMGGIGYALGAKAIGDVASELTPPDGDALAAKSLSRIATPDHNNALAAIEARAQLHSLLNDEVLRGYDPHEVAGHFNRLSQFAPSVSRKPLMAVPMVRKSIAQGQLDSFDAGGLADVESKFRSLHAPAKADKPAEKKGGAGVRSVLD